MRPRVDEALKASWLQKEATPVLPLTDSSLQLSVVSAATMMNLSRSEMTSLDERRGGHKTQLTGHVIEVASIKSRDQDDGLAE